MTNIPKLQDFIPSELTITNTSCELHHVFDEDDCYALWAAYSAGRPLLLRGKSGTGKSQTAKAIAEQLGWAFVSEVIQGSTDVSDLHWHYDAIARLGEAQVRSMEDDENECSSKNRLNPENFLTPSAFWWAYSWKTAQKQYEKCPMHAPPKEPDSSTELGKQWDMETGGVVLLLDEIDKADPDLPNGLLETLGNYQFTVPHSKTSPITADPSRVLTIITTNEERELPQAFVRRCFVHTLKMEDSEEIEEGLQKRYKWLVQRGQLHFQGQIADHVYLLAAKLLWKDRESPHLRYPPGLAEYIDLLNAIKDLDKNEQEKRLKKITNYALNKEVDN